MPKLIPGDTTASVSSIEGPGGATLENEALSGWAYNPAPSGTQVVLVGSLSVVCTVPAAGFSEAWARFQYWNGAIWVTCSPTVHANQIGAGVDSDSSAGPFTADISGVALNGFKVRAQIEWNVAGAGNTANMTADATDWYVYIPIKFAAVA